MTRGPAADRRALVVTAHPDDIEFGCAGTVCGWVDEGWDVRYVIVTSGQRGVQDPDQDPDAFGRLREDESRAAAALCGVTDVTFLRHMDSEVVYGPVLLRDLSRQFRRHRPHRLVTMNPEPLPSGSFVNHPDHRFVGQATLDVTITGGTTGAIFPELARDEGLPAWRDLEETWLFGAGGGETAVDVSATLDRKLAALEAHRSQVGEWDFRTFVTQRLAKRGAAHGMAYAETFRVITYRRVHSPDTRPA